MASTYAPVFARIRQTSTSVGLEKRIDVMRDHRAILFIRKQILIRAINQLYLYLDHIVDREIFLRELESTTRSPYILTTGIRITLKEKDKKKTNDRLFSKLALSIGEPH